MYTLREVYAYGICELLDLLSLKAVSLKTAPQLSDRRYRAVAAIDIDVRIDTNADALSFAAKGGLPVK